MKKPYLVKCIVCNKYFNSSDQKQKRHIKCVPKKIKKIYPKEFEHAKHEVQIRDHLTCQMCGKYLDNESRHPPTHHIDGNTMNNDLANLLLLCVSCHIKEHRKT